MAQLEVHREVSGAANTPCETPKPSVGASVVRRLTRYERTSAVNPVILGNSVSGFFRYHLGGGS